MRRTKRSRFNRLALCALFLIAALILVVLLVMQAVSWSVQHRIHAEIALIKEAGDSFILQEAGIYPLLHAPDRNMVLEELLQHGLAPPEEPHFDWIDRFFDGEQGLRNLALPMTRGNRIHFKEQLTKNHATMDAVLEEIRRTKARSYSIMYLDDSLEAEYLNPFRRSLNHIAYLYLAEMALAVDNRDPQKTIQAFRALMMIANFWQLEPNTLAQLAVKDTFEIAWLGLRRALYYGVFDDAQLKEILKLLTNYRDFDWYETGLKGDRALLFTQFTQRMRVSPDSFTKKRTGLSGGVSLVSEYNLLNILIGMRVIQHERQINPFCSLQHLLDHINEDLWYAQTRVRDLGHSDTLIDDIRYEMFPAGLLLETNLSMYSAFLRDRLHVNDMILAMAISAYAQANTQPPQSFEALFEWCGENLDTPLDYETLECLFQFRLEEDDFVVVEIDKTCGWAGGVEKAVRRLPEPVYVRWTGPAEPPRAQPDFTAIPVDGFADGIKHYRDATGRTEYARYEPEEVDKIADNIVLHQRANGGWPSNWDPLRILTGEERVELEKARTGEDTTFDNRATYTQIEYLAHAYHQTENTRHRDAALRGLHFVFAAQYPNGGWPHSYPSQSNYRPLITFNDDVMTGVLRLLRKAAAGEPAFGWLSGDLRSRAAGAVVRGNACILRLQIEVDGVLTAWAGQYDPVTLEPAQARSYELPSLMSAESVGVVRYLMDIEPPSPEIVRAVHSAVEWFERSKIEGIRIEQIDIEPVRYEHHTATFDRIVVEDPAARPIWARFYEIETNRPFMANRDGTKVYSLAEVAHERRTGYGWYTYAPAALLSRDYPAWQAKWAPAGASGEAD
jgi:PelA/Pel-15E family pectate lyase